MHDINDSTCALCSGKICSAHKKFLTSNAIPDSDGDAEAPVSEDDEGEESDESGHTLLSQESEEDNSDVETQGRPHQRKRSVDSASEDDSERDADDTPAEPPILSTPKGRRGSSRSKLLKPKRGRRERSESTEPSSSNKKSKKLKRTGSGASSTSTIEGSLVLQPLECE